MVSSQVMTTGFDAEPVSVIRLASGRSGIFSGTRPSVRMLPTLQSPKTGVSCACASRAERPSAAASSARM
jgi:hypothetical protein